jgi:hypothetical protein
MFELKAYDSTAQETEMLSLSLVLSLRSLRSSNSESLLFNSMREKNVYSRVEALHLPV